MKARKTNMLTNGDKLIVTKKVASFLDEGDIVEVINVTDDDIISFAFGENFMHMGVMNTAEFENHFKKVEDMAAKVEIPTITEDYIREIMENSEFETHTVFNKCTVVSCRLPNGFVITESSACVNSEDYDVKLGEEICINKIADKIWELEAYRLQQWLWEEEMIDSNSEDCPHGCDDCVNCTCDFEHCGKCFEEEDEENDWLM